MIPKNFTLIIVDCQNDYTDKEGSMYIDGSENKVKNICEFIKNNKSEIARVILTKDNHPKNHCSFTKNGGEWPEHCVENTFGVKTNENILNALKKNKIDYFVLNKGEVKNFEEYSSSMYSEYVDGIFVMKTATDSRCIYTPEVVICGMPGNTSVIATAGDLMKQIGGEKVYMFVDGIASTDDNTELMNFLENNTDVQII